MLRKNIGTNKQKEKKSVKPFDSLTVIDSTPGLLSPDESTTAVVQISFDVANGILNKSPPHMYILRGCFKHSYAYHWLRYIFPELIDHLLDYFERETKKLIGIHGPKVKNEVMLLIYQLKNLKCSIKRNNRMELFADNEDLQNWNDFILAQPFHGNRIYHVNFLFAQSYIYRKIFSFVQRKVIMHNYDLFMKAKQRLEHITMTNCLQLAEHFQNWENNLETFTELLEKTMWSNAYDSISSLKSEVNSSLENILKVSKKSILINKSKKVWRALSSYSDKRIEFMVSNVGVDLFSNYLLADYFLEFKYAVKVIFHMKAIPMGLTFATPPDAERMLKNLAQHPNKILKSYAIKWTAYFAENKFEIAKPDNFWHAPVEYFKMRNYNEHLYNYLSEAGLLIFIGDYHFRKLIGDFMWDSVEKFITCLRGFQPTDILALRIIRSDCLCGFKTGVSRKLKYYDHDWKYSCNYGTIQFEKSLNCGCHLQRSLRNITENNSVTD